MYIDALRERIDATLFADTHEHLLEESTRLRGAGAHTALPCTDAALLFHHYAADDLRAAGMSPAEQARFYAPDLPPADKWSLLDPYWSQCRTTGYIQAVRHTIRVLFGEDHLTRESFVAVSARMQAHARPGFYRDVLRSAGIASCQVHSFEAIFCESAQPDILLQDLNIASLSVKLRLPNLQRETSIIATTLDDMHAIIDWYFEHFGARAVAVKSHAAYVRGLDYDAVSAQQAAPIFARYARGDSVSPRERKALEDHLMRHCLRRATEYSLPVKLHCGYYAGNGYMPLGRVRQNAADLSRLLAAFPDTTFVLMHMGYPYQDEYIALAKHYANAYIDLCWAWIINPVATVRFVREFLVAAPASKLFTFGGDYSTVELVVGHTYMARHGLAQALRELVQTQWITGQDALDLVEPLMHANARQVFRL